MRLAIHMHSGETVHSVALEKCEEFFDRTIESWPSVTTIQFPTVRGRVMIPKSSIKYIELCR